MDLIKRESGERLHYVLKHYRKLAKKIKRLHPEEENLCRAYQNLDKAFDEVINEEFKFQVNFTNTKINIDDFVQSITKGISKKLNEMTRGAEENNERTQG